jgi:hypothetical protein
MATACAFVSKHSYGTGAGSGKNMTAACVINQYSTWRYRARVAAVPVHQGYRGGQTERRNFFQDEKKDKTKKTRKTKKQNGINILKNDIFPVKNLRKKKKSIWSGN